MDTVIQRRHRLHRSQRGRQTFYIVYRGGNAPEDPIFLARNRLQLPAAVVPTELIIISKEVNVNADVRNPEIDLEG